MYTEHLFWTQKETFKNSISCVIFLSVINKLSNLNQFHFSTGAKIAAFWTINFFLNTINFNSVMISFFLLVDFEQFYAGIQLLPFALALTHT